MKKAWVIFALLAVASRVHGDNTIVRFDTVLGGIEVLLYDTTAPATVSNFLNYVHRGAYENSFFHRSAPGFVIQGGGFTIESNTIYSVPVDPPVTNEFFYSNLRGTIAMAKLGGNPDSATSQWFFNLANNSGNLDNQNGGFTVFGRVLGDGMLVVDMLASVPIYDASIQLGSPFSDLPLLTSTLQVSSFLMVSNINVVPFGIDALSVSDAGVTISWSGPYSTGVHVERSSSPALDNWTMISATNRAGIFQDEITPGTAMYYRLVLPE